MNCECASNLSIFANLTTPLSPSSLSFFPPPPARCRRRPNNKWWRLSCSRPRGSPAIAQNCQNLVSSSILFASSSNLHLLIARVYNAAGNIASPSEERGLHLICPLPKPSHAISLFQRFSLVSQLPTKPAQKGR